MAITAPTIEKSVYNRIPYLVEGDSNNSLIGNYAAEVMGELYNVLEITEDDMLDQTKYTVPQKSLISDLVAIQMLSRQSLLNMEGNGTSSGAGNKQLKRAKAGEAETEFTSLKASDGAKLLQDAASMISRYMADAMRKARSLGFMLDIGKEGEFTIEVMSGGNMPLQSVNWE